MVDHDFRHYFRTQCKYVASRSRRPPLRRSRTSLLASISRPIKAFQNQDAVQPREPIPDTSIEKVSTSASSGILEERSQQPSDNTSNLHATVVTSSPDPLSVPLPPSYPPSHHSIAEDASVTSDFIRQRRVLAFTGTFHFPLQYIFLMLTRASEDDQYYRRSQSALSKVEGASEIPPTRSKKHEGFGGFPGPFDIMRKIFKLIAPATYRRLERSMTIPSMATLEEKKTPWLNFSGLIVGRNSYFRTDTLTAEQIQQIGGAEYRALEMLGWMVPAVGFFCTFIIACLPLAMSQYFVGIQLIGFLAFGPWLSITRKYDAAFHAQPRLVSKAWYSV
jgi:hypothetical protein